MKDLSREDQYILSRSKRFVQYIQNTGKYIMIYKLQTSLIYIYIYILDILFPI
jgi:hypothetical protein